MSEKGQVRKSMSSVQNMEELGRLYERDFKRRMVEGWTPEHSHHRGQLVALPQVRLSDGRRGRGGTLGGKQPSTCLRRCAADCPRRPVCSTRRSCLTQGLLIVETGNERVDGDDARHCYRTRLSTLLIAGWPRQLISSECKYACAERPRLVSIKRACVYRFNFTCLISLIGNLKSPATELQPDSPFDHKASSQWGQRSEKPRNGLPDLGPGQTASRNPNTTTANISTMKSKPITRSRQ
jgi:hypothetical protein